MTTLQTKDFALHKIVCKMHFVVLHHILHPRKITWPQECERCWQVRKSWEPHDRICIFGSWGYFGGVQGKMYIVDDQHIKEKKRIAKTRRLNNTMYTWWKVQKSFLATSNIKSLRSNEKGTQGRGRRRQEGWEGWKNREGCGQVSRVTMGWGEVGSKVKKKGGRTTDRGHRRA